MSLLVYLPILYALLSKSIFTGYIVILVHLRIRRLIAPRSQTDLKSQDFSLSMFDKSIILFGKAFRIVYQLSMFIPYVFVTMIVVFRNTVFRLCNIDNKLRFLFGRLYDFFLSFNETEIKNDDYVKAPFITGIVYFPFFMFSLIMFNDTSFIMSNLAVFSVLMGLFDDVTHEESHNWFLKRKMYNFFPPRTMQYSQIMYAPLVQHTAHVYVHHRVNQRENDIDDVGYFDRDSIINFFFWLSHWDIKTAFYPLFFLYKTNTTALRFHFKDFCTWSIFLVCCYFHSPTKFLLTYSFNMTYNIMQGIRTVFFEHPFQHKVDGSYNHEHNTLTLIESFDNRCYDDHAAHHIWSFLEHSADHCNNAALFAKYQIKSKGLMLVRSPEKYASTSFRYVLNYWYIPFCILSKKYDLLLDLVRFKHEADIDPLDIDDYTKFRNSITVDEIKYRLSKRETKICV